MKKLFCVAVLAYTAFCACQKKEIINDDSLYEEGWTRVIGVRGIDTSSTHYINGRVETDPQPLTYLNCGSQALGQVSNDCLCFTLIAYETLPNGKGKYTFKVMNRAWYGVIISWGSEQISITSISPSDYSLNGWETKTYTVIADAKVGKIRIKTNTNHCDDEWLRIPITVSILPIEFTDFKRERKGDQVTVTWNTDAPKDVDTFLILWTPTGKKEDEVCKYILASNPNRKQYSVTYPANKKLK